MSFRTRLLLALLPVALVPLVFFGLATRRAVSERIDAQERARIEEIATVIEEDLARASESVRLGLGRVALAIADDPRARALLAGADPAEAAPTGATDRAYLLDYASGMMPLVGLDLLRIVAEERILSSGHFRNEYDLPDEGLTSALVSLGNGPALAEVRGPEGTFLALVRRAPLRVGSDSLALVGGVRIDPEFMVRLERATDVRVHLELPGGTAAPTDAMRTTGTDEDGTAAGVGADGAGGALTREVPVPFVAAGGEGGTGSARFLLVGSTGPLEALLARLDRNLLGASVGAALFAFLLAMGVAARLGRPIEELALRAGRVNPERMAAPFATDRGDEVGDLARALDRMVSRLRAGTTRLREAERRAATGDLARQVHHDVRNGLIPVRNVVSHLVQVAEETPERTAETLLERRRTLDTGLAHLQALADTYARLSPPTAKEPCDLNEVARAAVEDAEIAAASPTLPLRVGLDLAPGPLVVLAPPVSLRRVLDNLLTNAIQSLGGANGSVRVATRRLPGTGPGDPDRAELVVTDTGRGMTADERARAFEDFFTTRPGGTGLGLSIVRRIVLDLGGSLDLVSAPGAGTRFAVTLPTAPVEGRADAVPPTGAGAGAESGR